VSKKTVNADVFRTANEGGSGAWHHVGSAISTNLRLRTTAFDVNICVASHVSCLRELDCYSLSLMSTFDTMALGRMVRAIRDRAGLTQADLAERASVSDETISRIERGAFEPAISTIVPVAEALGVSVDSLLGGRATRAIRNPTSALVQQLAVRAAQLDVSSQRALLRLAELLPTAKPSKKRPRRSAR
jgi:transcriptional regulator with XRE-family HTH domain